MNNSNKYVPELIAGSLNRKSDDKSTGQPTDKSKGWTSKVTTKPQRRPKANAKANASANASAKKVANVNVPQKPGLFSQIGSAFSNMAKQVVRPAGISVQPSVQQEPVKQEPVIPSVKKEPIIPPVKQEPFIPSVKQEPTFPPMPALETVEQVPFVPPVQVNVKPPIIPVQVKLEPSIPPVQVKVELPSVPSAPKVEPIAPSAPSAPKVEPPSAPKVEPIAPSQSILGQIGSAIGSLLPSTKPAKPAAKPLFNPLQKPLPVKLKDTSNLDLPMVELPPQDFSTQFETLQGYLTEPLLYNQPLHQTAEYLNLNEDGLPLKVTKKLSGRYIHLPNKPQFRHYLGGQLRSTVSIENVNDKIPLQSMTDVERFHRAVRMGVQYRESYIAIDLNTGQVAIIRKDFYPTLQPIITKTPKPYMVRDRKTPSWVFAVYKLQFKDTNHVQEGYVYEKKIQTSEYVKKVITPEEMKEMTRMQCSRNELGYFEFDRHQFSVVSLYNKFSESPGLAIFDSTGAGKTCKVTNLIGTNFQPEFDLLWVAPTTASIGKLLKEYFNDMCSIQARDKLAQIKIDALNRGKSEAEANAILAKKVDEITNENDPNANNRLMHDFHIGLSKNRTFVYEHMVGALATKCGVTIALSVTKETQGRAKKLLDKLLVLVIDEAHNIFSTSDSNPWHTKVTGGNLKLEDIYGPKWQSRTFLNDGVIRGRDLLAHYLYQSYKTFGSSSVRFMPISATIMNVNPNELFWIINLLHKDETVRLDMVRNNKWSEYIDIDTYKLKDESYDRLRQALQQNTTFAPANKDPTKFAQKVISEIIPVPLLDVHAEQVKQRIRESKTKDVSIEDIYMEFYRLTMMYDSQQKIPSGEVIAKWHTEYARLQFSDTAQAISHIKENIYPKYGDHSVITYETIHFNKDSVDYFNWNGVDSTLSKKSDQELEAQFAKGVTNPFQLIPEDIKQAFASGAFPVGNNASFTAAKPNSKRQWIEMFCPLIYKVIQHLKEQVKQNPNRKFAITCNATVTPGEKKGLFGTEVIRWALSTFNDIFEYVAEEDKATKNRPASSKITYTFLSSIDTKDAAKSHELTMFNDENNSRGQVCQVFIFDSMYKEGIDLTDTDILYMIEPSRTRTDFEQASSRIARMCRSQVQKFYKGIGAITRIVMICSTTSQKESLFEYINSATTDLERCRGENLCRIVSNIASRNAIDYDANKHLESNSVQIKFKVHQRINGTPVYYKGTAYPSEDPSDSFPVIVPHKAVVQTYNVGDIVDTGNANTTKITGYDKRRDVWQLSDGVSSFEATHDQFLLREGTDAMFKYYDAADTVAAIFDIAKTSTIFSGIDRQIIQFNAQLDRVVLKQEYTDAELKLICDTMQKLHEGFMGNNQFMLLVMYSILVTLSQTQASKQVDMAIPNDNNIEEFYMVWDGEKFGPHYRSFVRRMKETTKNFCVAFLKVHSKSSPVRHTNILIYHKRQNKVARIDLLGQLGEGLFDFAGVDASLAKMFECAVEPQLSLHIHGDQLREAYQNKTRVQCHYFDLSSLILVYYTVFYIIHHLNNDNASIKLLNNEVMQRLDDPNTERLTKQFLAIAQNLQELQTNIMTSELYDPELPVWKNTRREILQLVN